MQTRRAFLRNTSIAAAFLGKTDLLRGEPLNRPIGLQLYTVGEQLEADFHGTLKQIAAIGYKEVELADAYKKSAKEIRTALGDAGLSCRSTHMFDMQITSAQFMDFTQELGAKYVITSFNPPESVMAPLKQGKPDLDRYLKALEDMTLDDYKGSADICNKLGEEAKKHGLQYAYHNHNLEFKKLSGGTAYDLLLSSTDPELVKLELDCGWMAAAGYDPVAYLNKYPKRYRLLHIKAFKPRSSPSLSLLSGARPVPTELGRGGIDYKPVFAAAKKTEVEQYYVEQEPPYTEMSALEAIKVNYDFLHKMPN